MPTKQKEATSRSGRTAFPGRRDGLERPSYLRNLYIAGQSSLGVILWASAFAGHVPGRRAAGRGIAAS